MKFNTQQMSVLLEEFTYSDSMFGCNDDGDGVYFNQRVVHKMDLEVGDRVVAHCIPNYADKRDEIPWRCIRVSERTPAGYAVYRGITAMEKDG